MKRRGLFAVAIVAALALYAAVSLWPYEWLQVVNAAEPLSNGGVRFQKPGIALAKAVPTWVQTAMRSQRLAIFLRVRSFVPKQYGPARIFSLSIDPYQRNLTIGQEGADLVLRLRTAWTDANGTIDNRPVARLPGLFVTDDWFDLRILIEPGSLRIAVGGDVLVNKALPSRPLEPWDMSYRLVLGNEVTGNRPWLGEIRRAVVRVNHSIEDYAEPSKLEFPPVGIFGLRQGKPKLIPLRDMNPRDAIENVGLYVPLGLLLGFLVGTRHRSSHCGVVFGALLFAAAVSICMEVLQVLVPQRAPSVDDVIFNTLGGGLGFLIAFWAQPLLGTALRRSIPPGAQRDKGE